jgi:hypothetical protein
VTARRKKDADPLVGAVKKAALEAITALAAGWLYAPRYDDLREVTLAAFYRALGMHVGMRVGHPLGVLPPLRPDTIAAFLTAVNQLPHADLTPEHYGSVHEVLSHYMLLDGRVALRNDRHASTIYFTPRSLTEPIVRRTLEPLLPLYPPEKTLELRCADPACGGGAFLLEVVRQLGARALSAGLANDEHEAKRLVAIHCMYGTDIGPLAVLTAKRAITLECRADQMPADWLDDNIKCGDALVGLPNEPFEGAAASKGSIKSFHWREAHPNDAIAKLVDNAMSLGVAARRLRMARLADLARSARR